MADQLQAVTEAHFEVEVIKASIPVVVDFWAEWCAPCKMMTPLLKEASLVYEGKIKILGLNVDEQSAMAQQFGVRGIPALLAFKQGEVVATRVGVLSKTDLISFLDSLLG